MTATRPDPSVDLSELERDYIVKRELGQGGMGSVFLARHRTAGHDVAIKVISSKYIADADALSRFEREARATAALKSPHTVQLYDFGATEDGQISQALLGMYHGMVSHSVIMSECQKAEPPQWGAHVTRRLCCVRGGR